MRLFKLIALFLMVVNISYAEPIGGTGSSNPNSDQRLQYHPGTFCEIHVHDGSTAQSIPTGAGYEKLTGFDNDGVSNNCTNDSANDKITVTKPGYYKANVSISGFSGTANVVFFFAIFINGVEQDQCHINRKYATANDVGSGAITCIIDVTTAPWDVDVRARHDNGGAINFTPTYMNLDLSYLGET